MQKIALAALVVACRSAPEVLIEPQPITQVLQEPAGDNCPEGGLVVVSGVDADADGTLSETETATRAYVCNGQNGEDGLPGENGATGDVTQANVLTRTSSEPKGSNCAYAGTRVEVGFDDNGNGIFDDGERDSVFFVCGEDPLTHVHTGNLLLETQADVDAAKHLTSVVGDVIVSTTAVIAVELPNLSVVHGTIRDCNGSVNHAWSLVLPKLGAAVGGITMACAPDLTTVQAPLLAYAGRLRIDGAPVTSLDFSALRDVAGDLRVHGTPLPTGYFNLAAPELTRVGGVMSVRDNPNIDDCALITFVHARRFAGAYLVLDAANDLCNADYNEHLQACPSLQVNDDTTGRRLCYYKTTWNNAKTECENIGLGWSLDYLVSDDDLSALSGATGLHSLGTGVWIGYTDSAVDGTFAWLQSPTGYAPQAGAPLWVQGQPNGDNSENCVELSVHGDALAASDAVCSEATRYPLCRYLAP